MAIIGDAFLFIDTQKHKKENIFQLLYFYYLMSFFFLNQKYSEFFKQVLLDIFVQIDAKFTHELTS